MANLYDIEQEILGCFDTETGEILDADKLDALMIERDAKLENVALWVKNLQSDAEAFKAEKNAFEEREKAALNKAESLKRWLANALAGQKFSTTKVSVGFRKSKAVETEDEQAFIDWAQSNDRDDLLSFKKPTVNKTAVKKGLENGDTICGASIVERENIFIK